MKRGRFQWVRQIVRFNRRQYLLAAASIAAALLAGWRLGPFWRAVMFAAALPALFWLGSSLVVSYYVYDCSSLYGLGWLRRHLAVVPRHWINLHAGLDETTPLLAALFPSATGAALDIYDARAMTEPSIAAARRGSIPPVPAIPSDWRALPLANACVDMALLMFVAHELRRPAERSQLFREIERVLRPGGRAVVVEHPRDWANFLAFGPGFLHFFPRKAWRLAARAGGLRVRTEIPLNPFVRLFVLERTS